MSLRVPKRGHSLKIFVRTSETRSRNTIPRQTSALEEAADELGFETTVSLLHRQWMELLKYLAREPDPEASVRIIAWDFQQPVLWVMRERGVLPAKARVGVCLLQAE